MVSAVVMAVVMTGPAFLGVCFPCSSKSMVLPARLGLKPISTADIHDGAFLQVRIIMCRNVAKIVLAAFREKNRFIHSGERG
jgi:hypothetical protein